MTATFTATPDPTNDPPRVILSGSGFTGSTVKVTRVDDAGNTVTVRGMAAAAVTSGNFLGFDYEAPYYTSATWTAVTTTNTVTTPSTILTSAQPWLVHPGIPSLSQPLTVTGKGDEVSDLNQGVHRPLGRRTPIVITDGQRHAPTFDLTVDTETQTDEDNLTTLLDDTTTLLLQIGYDPTIGVTRTFYGWVSVGPVTKSPQSQDFRDDAGGNCFTWTLPCTVSSRPAGSILPQRTWASVTGQYASWSAVKAAYTSWRDEVLDNPSTPAVSTDTVIVVVNGDGTLTLTGTGVTDPGTGVLTLSLTSPGDVDNSATTGTLTLV